MAKSCNTDVLNLFGFESIKDGIPRKATAEEKSYCVRNYYTCCTENDYDNMRKNFTLKKKVFKKKVDLLEELLSLFVGENHQ